MFQLQSCFAHVPRRRKDLLPCAVCDDVLQRSQRPKLLSTRFQPPLPHARPAKFHADYTNVFFVFTRLQRKDSHADRSHLKWVVLDLTACPPLTPTCPPSSLHSDRFVEADISYERDHTLCGRPLSLGVMFSRTNLDVVCVTAYSLFTPNTISVRG